MTEAEWLACRDPSVLLAFMGKKAGKRKRRLFGCACCRRIWPLIVGEASRQAVEVAERFADGLVSELDMISVEAEARRATWGNYPEWSGTREAAIACSWVVAKYPANASSAWQAVLDARQWARVGERGNRPGQPEFEAILREVADEELPQLAALLREIFGNPFRPVAVDPAWLTSDVLALARGIYDERAFDRMPILADALQDAGCDSDELLNHLRDPNATHVRGCWALDLVLGKG